MKHACLLVLGLFSILPTTASAFQSDEAVKRLQPRNNDVLRQAREYHALVEAENGRSSTCKSYVGKIVRVTPFDGLAAKYDSAGEKREFETTAQYEARRAFLANVSTGPSIVVLPTDREYIKYDADTRGMTINAGAFAPGAFSTEPNAEVAAMMFLSNDGPPGVAVHHSQSERLLGTETGRTGLGVPMRISKIERHTRALYLKSARLFSFANGLDSPFLTFEASVSQAPRLKQTIKVALVIVPTDPYISGSSMDGWSPTARVPIRYTEKSTILWANAKCGLALDVQSHVLAAVDAG